MTIKEKLITYLNLLTEKELSTIFKTATLFLFSARKDKNKGKYIRFDHLIGEVP